MLEIFALAAPEMLAALGEGTAAAATAAEVAAAAEAAATAAAAAEAAQAAAAAQSASGIMQASPELMNSVANFAPETSMFGPESTQLAGPLPPSYITQPIDASLSSLPEVQATPSNMAPGVNAPSPPPYQLGPNVPPSGPLQPPLQGDALRTTLNNAYGNVGQGIDTASASSYEGLGTQPGGPYDTSKFSNAIGDPNTIANNPTGLQQFDNPAPTGDGITRTMPAADPYAKPPIQLQGYAPYDSATGTYGEVRGGTDSSFMKGFNAVSDWAEKNPFKAAGLGYMAYSALNKPEPYKSTPYDGPLSKFRISPNFQGRQANPQDFQYTPRTYANGGITDIHSYAKGKLIRPNINDNDDVGIYRDTDPDTTNLDPLTAAMLLQSKLNKRSYVNTKSKFNKPTPMGTLNFDPVIASAAQGGIMGASNLGGYAAGGNPRLLRGPGDGMSDNIPATINNRQPARLADGEFVVPADVVSHLGNGSTEAGAKKLHEMMNQVRKARTGNQKQGKQINPSRFMPK